MQRFLKGEFNCEEVKWMHPKYGSNAERNLKKNLKNWHKTKIKNGLTHLVWQLKAIKKCDQ